MMEGYNIIPSVVINLNLETDECLSRTSPDPASGKYARLFELTFINYICRHDTLLHNCTDIIHQRLHLYAQQSTNILLYFTAAYGNVLDLDACKSKWWLYTQAEKLIRSSIYHRLTHIQATSQGIYVIINKIAAVTHVYF